MIHPTNSRLEYEDLVYRVLGGSCLIVYTVTSAINVL